MKNDGRRPRFRRGLAGVVLAGVLLALWGASTYGSLPSDTSEPTIESVTPESGPEGMVVTIEGANFGLWVGAVQGTSGVSFNGVWSTPSSWSDSAITVAVPPGAATGKVVVTVSGQASEGVEFSVTGEGVSSPAIGTVSPMLGSKGTVVTIRGKNFGSMAQTGAVSFNGVWASASSWSDEEIRVRVPADAMTGSVVVTASGQVSNGVAFIVPDSGLGEPAIDSLSAASGPQGMVVTIEGENFGPSIGALEGMSGVSFNGVWGTPTYWSETQIQVAVPAGAPSGLVTVAVGGESSNGLGFVVERAAPVIEAVDTDVGSAGTTVEISGRNFGPAMEAVQGWSGVGIEGVWGEPTYWSETVIRVAVPEGVSNGLIVVSSGGQESNGIPFTVTGAETMSPTPAVLASSVGERTGPVIEKLKPEAGQVGESVKIKGSNFGASRGTSTVSFNGTAVTDYVSWGNTKIQVRVPEGATTGPVVVTVDGQASSGLTFTVTEPAPAINDNGLIPDSGPVGTSVKVKGLNFGASRGESTVTFNGVEAQPSSWSDTKIQVPVPEGATTGPLVVTVDGQASNGVTFTVPPLPRLTLATNLSSVSEPSGTATLTVSVPSGSEPEADLTVTLSHTGTAGEGSDYSVGTLTILDGEVSGMATLTVIDDSVYEGEESIVLTAGATGYADSAVLTIALEEDEPAPLTAQFVELPEMHGGYGTVSLRILFSEAISTGAMTLRDSSFAVTNGSVGNVGPVNGRSDLWEIGVAPSSDTDMVVVLPATSDCAAAGAVCTAGGKALSNRLEATIPWVDPGPPVVSIVAVEERLTGPIGEFRLFRTGPAAEPLEVQVLFANSRNPSVKTLTIRFDRGHISAPRRVQGGDNNLVEDDITVTLTLQEGEGYTVSSEHPSASLVLEESEIPEFTVSAEPAEISEGESATVTVSIVNGVRFRHDQAIDLAVSGSASGSDYTGVPATLKLDAWTTAATLATLTATVDRQDEGAETVTITASHDGTEIGTATVTIAAGEASP